SFPGEVSLGERRLDTQEPSHLLRCVDDVSAHTVADGGLAGRRKAAAQTAASLPPPHLSERGLRPPIEGPPHLARAQGGASMVGVDPWARAVLFSRRPGDVSTNGGNRTCCHGDD